MTPDAPWCSRSRASVATKIAMKIRIGGDGKDRSTCRETSARFYTMLDACLHGSRDLDELASITYVCRVGQYDVVESTSTIVEAGVYMGGVN